MREGPEHITGEGHQTCKRYSLQTTKDTAISLPYSEMRSFEGSKFTFSVDRMHGECQNGSVYSTSIDLLFVRVMPRQFRSS